MSRPVLVELFTSQGCSSCPPADAVLDELARRPGVLALAFHVDYWDRLGWRDPYSLAAATRRQMGYSGALGTQTYTPQLVVDGKADAVGSDRPAVDGLITRAARATGPAVAASLHRDSGRIAWHVDAATAPVQGVVLLVTYDRSHTTPVRGGENSGRTLRSTQVVRSVRVIGRYDGTQAGGRSDAAADEIGELSALLVQQPTGAVIALATSG